jgi:hypothetical protein
MRLRHLLNANHFLPSTILLLSALSVITILSVTNPTKAFADEWFGPSGPDGTGPAATIVIEGRRSSLHYGTPRNCRIIFQRPTVCTETKFEAWVDSATGGWCDNLWDGHISITLTDENKINYTLTDKDNDVLDQGALQKD